MNHNNVLLQQQDSESAPEGKMINHLKKAQSLFSFNYTVFLKGYIRIRVVHDLKTALVHFRDLEPVVDKYGKNKNTGEMSYVKLENSL